MEKRQHFDLIVAWANGETIQAFVEGGWETVERPGFWPDIQYRIKPKPIMYRLCLWTPSLSKEPILHMVTKDEESKNSRENWNGFVKWVTDWIEVEI